MTRLAHRTRELSAGCSVCKGEEPIWTGANAQALAARHHDKHRHATWCDIRISVRYGQQEADPRQIDIEDAISEASA